jgi:hypothetical protein
MQDKIKTIREKCIEANPSIKDLVFGCKVKIINYDDFDHNDEYPLEQTITYVTEYDFGESDDVHTLEVGHLEYEFEIIGRDIRLADVLLAINKTNKKDSRGNVGIQSNGCFIFFRHSEGRPELQLAQWYNRPREYFETYEWNLLKDNLEDQSEETINFIYNLLQ